VLVRLLDCKAHASCKPYLSIFTPGDLVLGLLHHLIIRGILMISIQQYGKAGFSQHHMI